jgi:hypothetical protein
MKPDSIWYLLRFACLFLTACGASSQQGDGGAVPPSINSIATLSDPELGALCEQLAATEGGYSHAKMLACEAGTQAISFQIGPDQAQCKQLLRAVGASCGVLTVGAVQGCVTDIYAETCSSASPIPSSCDPFFSCLVGDASSQ